MSEPTEGAPRLSVVLCTFRRPDGAERALASLLAQPVDDLEVVVADAGDPEETMAALAAHRDDPRWRLVPVPDLGLCRLRNDGGAATNGRWLAFLDDDDRVDPGWAEALLARTSGPDVAIVSCGARLVDDDGREVGTRASTPMPGLLRGFDANVLAGCWIVRRDVIDAAGWFLPGLMWAHQTELWIRMATICDELGLSTVLVDRLLTRIHRRAASDRRLGNPRLLVDGTRWIMARHADAYARDPEATATAHRVMGVNLARCGDLREARREFLRSLRVQPDATTVARAAITAVPPLATRVWGRVERGRYETDAVGQGLRAVAAATDPDHRTDALFLPWRYRENPPASADRDGTPFWEAGTESSDVRNQDPVYRWAARLARDPANLPVLDVGCGTGHKLVRRIGAVTDRFTGVDQPSGIELARTAFPRGDWVAGDLGDPAFWHELADRRPGLVMCCDVIEHLEDPIELLRRLRAVTAGRVLLSTPDRARLEGSDPLGPPSNRRHIREWSADELRLLCESVGFRVVRARHLLPRSYSPTRTDLNRTLYRLLHRKAVPDRRYSHAVLLEPVP